MICIILRIKMIYPSFAAAFIALFVYCKLSHLSAFANPIKKSTGFSEAEILDIDEIASREYDTVHGRILAVNMATLGKRRLQGRPLNPFERIENFNDHQHLNLYQGDIQLDEETEELLHMPNRTVTKRNAHRRRVSLWTSRTIPYLVPRYMAHIKGNLLTAISYFHKHTCLRFVPYRPGLHRNYIKFTNNQGCSSKIGKRYVSPGPQHLSLSRGYEDVGTILHELLHAVGFWHEQSRPDRDRYVKIYWENILEGRADQFDKYSLETLDTLGVSYDYSSIMHYSRKTFSKNGKPTIVAIGNENHEFGTKEDRFSPKDIIEINALYDCKVKQYGWSSWSEFSPCSKKCYKRRERYCYNPGKLQYCGPDTNIYGVHVDRVKCTKRECLARDAINGHWGHWSKWSECSVTCNDGLRSRVRKCNNPAPSKYGKPCPGRSKEIGLCTVRRCHPGPEDTDFDDPKRPFGIWRNKPGAQLKWIRHRPFSQTMNTGPHFDHTLRNFYGYYLYMESSGPGTANKQAKLISKTLKNLPGGQCLKFYYSMYGRTIGSLEVRLNKGGKKYKTLFYKRGDQGKAWQLATADLDVHGQYQIEFIATVGQRGYSDIAIDDVYIDDGQCSCQDKYATCVKWSKEGECQKNKIWMSKNCRKSCKICSANCKDWKRGQCLLWAEKGECSKNKVWMYKNCPRSCGKCFVAECEDSSKVQCPLWAKNGECSKNKAYMHKHCQKSCSICKATDCADSDSWKKKCPMWAKKGECKKNKDFMYTNCSRSCNIC